MSRAKIHFSPMEMNLMTSTEWILTKNGILQKLKGMLEKQQEAYREIAEDGKNIRFPGLFSVHPKISRGENYLGLPWLILDYPRIFEKENIFAVRTMFWWGKFFSITLHLSGSWKDRLEEALDRQKPSLISHDFYCSVAEDPWLHHFEESNYLPVTGETDIRNRPFIKLAKRYPLDDPEHSLELIKKDFSLLIGWICN